jgi:hypothetical protein
MSKNRLLLVLGMLPLLLVTMAVSLPHFNAPASEDLSWPPRPVIAPPMGGIHPNVEESRPYIMDSATRSYIAWGEALRAAPKLGESTTSEYLDYYQRHPALRLGLPTSTYTILNPSLLDECFDVSISELAACREASQSASQ